MQLCCRERKDGHHELASATERSRKPIQCFRDAMPDDGNELNWDKKKTINKTQALDLQVSIGCTSLPNYLNYPESALRAMRINEHIGTSNSPPTTSSTSPNSDLISQRYQQARPS